MVGLIVRAKNKLFRVIKNPKDLGYELEFVRRGIKPSPEKRMKAGVNWEMNPDFPIAILWGFSQEGHKNIELFFPEYRVLLVGKYSSISKIIKKNEDINNSEYAWNTKGMIFVKWNKNELPIMASLYAKTKKIDVWIVKYSYLKSFNTSVFDLKPYSFFFQKKKIHSKQQKPSALEIALSSKNKNVAIRSSVVLDVVKAWGIDSFEQFTNNKKLKIANNFSLLIARKNKILFKKNNGNLTTNLDRLKEFLTLNHLNNTRYIHPGSNETCSLIDIISYFLVEHFLYDDIANIPQSHLDFSLLKKHIDYLPAPLKVLIYLNDTPFAGSADTEKIISITEENFCLSDFYQIAHLLTQTANYDALIKICALTIEKFAKDWDTLKFNISLINSILITLSFAQGRSNGRAIGSIPDFAKDLSELMIDNSKYNSVIIHYSRLKAHQLEYDHLDILIQELNKLDDMPYTVIMGITATLLVKPTRKERNHSKRKLLLNKAAKYTLLSLNKNFSSDYDLSLNSVMHAMMTDKVNDVISSYNDFIKQFPKDTFSFVNPKLKTWGFISRREGHILAIYSYLIKKGEFEFAKKILSSHLFPPNRKLNSRQRKIFETNLLTSYFSQNKHKEFILTYCSATEPTQTTTRLQILYAKTLRIVGELEKARIVLTNAKRKPKTPAQRATLNVEIGRVDFTSKSSEILNSYPQPQNPKGVIIIASWTCFNSLALLVPALLILKKRGYAIISPMPGMLKLNPTGLPLIDQFTNCIPATLNHYENKYTWTVDWEKNIVKASNINFFQGFNERMMINGRKFYNNIQEYQTRIYFLFQNKMSDVSLDICHNVYSELVQKDLNVCFITNDSHATPLSIFRDFCIEKDDPRLSFVSCSIAYENYFSNLGSKLSSTMCVTDMTLHKNRRAPFLALKERFDDWYELNKTDRKLKEHAENMIKVNRNSSLDNKEEKELIAYLKEQKKKGKKIICCFGKVPVDLGVPYDGGPAHKDMFDWINHSVEICGKSEDIILLVKPHPHELRPEIAMDLITKFSGLIECEVKPNVKILGHKSINVHALAPLLDLAILYNGSSSLELTALGIPVLMASFFGKHDYPLDLIYPENRTQYEEYILATKYKKPSAKTREKAAFLISYMGSDDVSIKNEYSRRQSTNDTIGVPVWYEDKIADFLENGDPAMDLIASRIVEKFEGKLPLPSEMKK